MDALLETGLSDISIVTLYQMCIVGSYLHTATAGYTIIIIIIIVVQVAYS